MVCLHQRFKILLVQISWGNSVENALESFAKRVNTKLIRRTVSLIIEASRSGGNVADVLDAASKDARELKFIDAERRAGMLSYVAVVYVSMIVFLMVIVILCKSLIPAMLGEGHGGLSAAMGSSGNITQYDITVCIFYNNYNSGCWVWALSLVYLKTEK